MCRYAIEELFKWKEKPIRKPMIIHGARHVGKTWLMKEFGKKAYTHTVCSCLCYFFTVRSVGFRKLRYDRLSARKNKINGINRHNG